MSGHTALSYPHRLALMTSYVLTSLAGQVVAEDPALSPTPEEREAVAALAAAGVSLRINGEFQVVSISVVGRNDANDDTLALLTHLPHLESVSLMAADLTDASLKHFEGLKHLRMLSIRNSAFSEEAIEQLQAALPECRISRSRSPAGFAFGGRGAAQRAPGNLDNARAFEAARAAQERAAANAPADIEAARAAAFGRAMEQRARIGIPADVAAGRAASGFGFSSRAMPSPLLQELINTDVQIELQMTSEQWKLVEAMRADAETAQREIVDDLRTAEQGNDPTAPEKLGERVRAAAGELRAAADERLKALLTAEQFQRLQQLACQTAGPRLLLDAEFTSDLNLSDEQRAQLETVREDQGKLMEAMRTQRLNGESTRQNLALLRGIVWNERLLSVLTDEQRALYEQKLGPPRESNDEQQLAQHVFALLDANGNEQIDDAEWNSETAGRFLSALPPRAVGAAPLSRDDFVQMYVAARHRSTRSGRRVGF